MLAINTGNAVLSGSDDEARLTFNETVRRPLCADEMSTGTPPARRITSPAITGASGCDAGAASTEARPSDISAAPIGCSESPTVNGPAAAVSSAAGIVNSPEPSAGASTQASHTTTSYRTPGRFSRSTVSAGFVRSDCSRKKFPAVSSSTRIGSARGAPSIARAVGAAAGVGVGTRVRQLMAGRASAAMTTSMNAICNASSR